MLKLLFPFLLGLFLVVAQPLLDLACEHALKRLQYDSRAIEAARWTGSTAAFLPAAVLTAYGALVVMWDEGRPASGDALLMWTIGLLIVGFFLFLYSVTRGAPATDWEGPTKQFQYTFLQLVLAGLNVVGIGFVVWYSQ